MKVSIALPIFNAEKYLDQCFESILKQNLGLNASNVNVGSYTYTNAPNFCESAGFDRDSGSKESRTPKNDQLETDNHDDIERIEIEVSMYEDGSTDSSSSIIDKWSKMFESEPGFSIQLSKNDSGRPKGVGYGRNQGIRQSTGEYICFCDADDVMSPNRIRSQLLLCRQHPNAIIGTKFKRIPEDSTRNFTFWANSITQTQLTTQIYQSFGPSVIMPTWFCHRDTYERVEGGFDETGKGVPEDLIFFYKHLDCGGDVRRVDEELVLYRYHPDATTFTVTDDAIWKIRLKRLEEKVLSQWNKFSIWNAGKLGRRLYRSLSQASKDKVTCLCDVDKKKILQKSYHPYPLPIKVPILHVKDAASPFVICVKTDLTFDENGDFRKRLDSLSLQEGVDYFYFN